MTIQQQIVASAIAQGIDPNFALAVAQRESGFNQGAVGSSGEIGVFQLMPTTAQQLSVNPYDQQANIDGGIKYLKQQLNAFGNDPALAAAAYNAGPNGDFSNPSVTQYANDVTNLYASNAAQDVAAQISPSGPIPAGLLSGDNSWVWIAAAVVGVLVVGGR